MAVARVSLRRYDVQAVYALILSVAAVVPLLGAAALFVRNFHFDVGQVLYTEGSKFLPVYLGTVAVSGLLGVVGCLLGWSSAGQRRNPRQAWSWLGFFVGGSVITLDFILLAAFVLLRLQVPSSA